MRVDDNRTGTVGVVSDEDKKVLATIKHITAKGNNAEVKKRSDGSLTVYEVKKNLMQ